jgi:hypothetical protein
VVQDVLAHLAELMWPQVACAVVQGFPLGAKELGPAKGRKALGLVSMTSYVAAAAAERYATPASVGFVWDRHSPL